MRTLHIIKTCDTHDSRAEGLQNTEITRDECCLFLFDAKSQHSFWGLNTKQTLWVNFVDDENYVMESYPIFPNDLRPVKSIGKYRMAFETLDSCLFCHISIDNDKLKLGMADA